MYSFLFAHRTRHAMYAQVMAIAGFNSGGQVLDMYPPDDAWFLQHANAHQLIQTAGFMLPDQTVNLTVLTQYVWDNQSDFSTWMQMHTLIHDRIDQQLGIFS